MNKNNSTDLDQILLEAKKNINTFFDLIEKSISDVLPNKEDENFKQNLVSFFILHDAFAILYQIKYNLEKNRNHTLSLLSRYAFELYGDYRLLFCDKKLATKRVEAWWKYTDMKREELLNGLKVNKEHSAREEWKVVAEGPQNQHWSGKQKSEILESFDLEKEGFLRNMYKRLSTFAHPTPGFMTENTFYNYSETANSILKLGTCFGACSLVEIFLLAHKNSLYGLKNLTEIDQFMEELENLQDMYQKNIFST